MVVLGFQKREVGEEQKGIEIRGGEERKGKERLGLGGMRRARVLLVGGGKGAGEERGHAVEVLAALLSTVAEGEDVIEEEKTRAARSLVGLHCG